MTTRIGFLCGIIALLATVFSKYKIPFAIIGIVAFIFAYISHGRNIPKGANSAKTIPTKEKPIKLTNEHTSILKAFRSNDGELLSVDDLTYSTGIETFKINLILDELVSQSIIHATNYDDLNGGWQYQLSDKGRKLIIKTSHNQANAADPKGRAAD